MLGVQHPVLAEFSTCDGYRVLQIAGQSIDGQQALARLSFQAFCPLLILVRSQLQEEDLFVFKDTIEGPRAPAVKPGRIITQA
jgi:hypothetical protein